MLFTNRLIIEYQTNSKNWNISSSFPLPRIWVWSLKKAENSLKRVENSLCIFLWATSKACFAYKPKSCLELHDLGFCLVIEKKLWCLRFGIRWWISEQIVFSFSFLIVQWLCITWFFRCSRPPFQGQAFELSKSPESPLEYFWATSEPELSCIGPSHCQGLGRAPGKWMRRQVGSSWVLSSKGPDYCKREGRFGGAFAWSITFQLWRRGFLRWTQRPWGFCSVILRLSHNSYFWVIIDLDLLLVTWWIFDGWIPQTYFRI